MAFPEIGLKARLDLGAWTRPLERVFRDAKKLDKIFQTTAKNVSNSVKTMTKDWIAFERQSAVFDRLKQSGSMQDYVDAVTQLRKIWKDMGKPKIDTAMFDTLVGKGYDISKAFRAAAGDTTALGDKIKFLGFTVSKTALAVAGATAAFSVLFKLVSQGVKDFQDLGNEVRILQYQFGGTTAEASAWIRITDRAGVSLSSLESTVGMFQKSLIDMELRLAEGKESSTQFTRALDTLNVNLYDIQGNLRPTTELVEEIAQKISALGPGPAATGLSEAIFGRGGRQIIPLLHEIAGGLEEATEETVRFGTKMSELDKDMADNARVASVDLKTAWKGISVFIGRVFIPATIGAKEALADILVTIRQIAIGLGAAGAGFGALIQGQGLKAAGDAMREAFRNLSGVGTEAANAAEEASVELDNLRNAAVISEEKLELLNDRLAEARQELSDLADEFQDRKADLVLQFGEPGELGGRRWDDILIGRLRELEDAQIARFRQDRDLWISHNQRLEDIHRRHARRIKEIEEDQQERINDYRRDAQRRREELEIDHIRRLRDIRLDYFDTIEEAARKNDAVAVVRAIRDRAKAERDERLRYQDEQEDLQRNLDEKLQQIKEQAEKQRQELKDNLQEQLEDLEINYRRQLEAQQRALADQREDRERSWRRQEEDFNRTKQRQFDDLQRWYDKEKQAQEEHIREMSAQAVTLMNQTAQQVAQAVMDGILIITQAGTAALASGGWGNSAPGWWDPFGNYQTPGSGSGPSFDPNAWYQRQSGGLDIVNGPTHFTFGEGGGAEAILSVPLRGQVTHSHQFSPLSIGFDGIPAGTDTRQMESMMLRVMTKLFDQVGIGNG